MLYGIEEDDARICSTSLASPGGNLSVIDLTLIDKSYAFCQAIRSVNFMTPRSCTSTWGVQEGAVFSTGDRPDFGIVLDRGSSLRSQSRKRAKESPLPASWTTAGGRGCSRTACRCSGADPRAPA